MKTIGVWFTEGEEKQALSTIKTKHKQVVARVKLALFRLKVDGFVPQTPAC